MRSWISKTMLIIPVLAGLSLVSMGDAFNEAEAFGWSSDDAIPMTVADTPFE